MARTKIEWCDRVWNPVTGCAKISPGCQNCYAERMAKRLAGRCGYPKDEPFQVTLHHNRLDEPYRWRKPSRVFICSMGDLFHPDVQPIWLSMVFNVIQKCPQHTFMVLTKRPKIAWEHTHNTMLRPYFGLPNLWLGVTVENQEQADKRIPVLLQIPAAVRFVSVEPMLGPVNLSWIDLGEHVTQGYGPRRIIWDVLRGWEFQYEPGKERYKDLAKAKCMVSLGARMDWVICGGETGHGARPMHPDWVRSLRDQCQDAGVNFFFKQWGEFAPVGWIHSDSKGVIVRPDGYVCCDRSELASAHNYEMARVGKKKAGRFLDGREWNEMPEVCSKYPGERPDRQQAAPT